MNETEILNQIGTWTDMWMYASMFTPGPWTIIVQLLFLVLTGWGLWKINQKLKEPHPWLSWVPILNIYSYVRASWKPNIWILWLILWTIAIIIPILWIILFLYLYFTVLNWISKRTWNWVWTTIWLFFLPFIFLPLIGHQFNPENVNKAEEKKETVEL